MPIHISKQLWDSGIYGIWFHYFLTWNRDHNNTISVKFLTYLLPNCCKKYGYRINQICLLKKRIIDGIKKKIIVMPNMANQLSRPISFSNIQGSKCFSLFCNLHCDRSLLILVPLGFRELRWMNHNYNQLKLPYREIIRILNHFPSYHHV